MKIDPVLQAHRSLVVAVAAVLPLAACAILALFHDSIVNTNAALCLVLLVVAAASTGIRWAGIVAALTSAAGFDYFLTDPYNTLSISDRGDIETAALLLLIGVAVTEVALWGRREQALASTEQGYLNGVLGTASMVASGRSSTAELIDRVCQQIVDVLHIDSCRFDPAHRSGLPALHSSGTLTRAGHEIDVSRKGLPIDSKMTLMVQRGGVTYGQFVLTASTRVVRPSKEQIQVAVTLADQVGAALATGTAGQAQAARQT
ncbi:DUF4118 domain-containing protein [Nakamurella sp. GG22]